MRQFHEFQFLYLYILLFYLYDIDVGDRWKKVFFSWPEWHYFLAWVGINKFVFQACGLNVKISKAWKALSWMSGNQNYKLSYQDRQDKCFHFNFSITPCIFHFKLHFFNGKKRNRNVGFGLNTPIPFLVLNMSGIDNIIRGTKSGESNVSISLFTTVYQKNKWCKCQLSTAHRRKGTSTFKIGYTGMTWHQPGFKKVWCAVLT